MLNYYFNLIIKLNNWINLVIESISIGLCCGIFEPCSSLDNIIVQSGQL